jgi:hypothetical protein
MRRYPDIAPESIVSLVFGGLEIQVQTTLNISSIKYKKN